MYDDNNDSEKRGFDTDRNAAWRKKPISERQFQLLHDLFCALIGTADRGQASDMIQTFLKRKNPFSPIAHKFDDDTLERHK